MNPLKSLKAAFWLVFISTVLCISLIAVLDITLITVILIILPWLATVIIYIMAYVDHSPTDIIKSEETLIPSKGTSNADRMGEKVYDSENNTVTRAEALGDVIESVKTHKKSQISSGVSSTIEIEGKLLRYDEPIPMAEDYERLLSEYELEMMEKHYFGFYHSIGVDMLGHIQVAPRVNGLATHYVTPEILAQYMLDEEE